MMKIVRGRSARSSNKTHNNDAVQNRFDLIPAAPLSPTSTSKIVGSRRHSLLAATAFAGAFVALMAANPQSAVAGCVVGAGSYTCAATTTTDTSFPTNPPNDRNLPFGVGPGVATTTVNGLIDGFGLATSVQSASDVLNVVNNSTVSVTGGNSPTAGGTAVFNVTNTGGATSVLNYTGTGNVINNGGGAGVTDGLFMNSNGGDVNFGVSGTPINGNFTGGNSSTSAALHMQTTTGAVNAFVGTGTYTAQTSNSNGILLQTSTGAINATLGAATITNASGAVGSTFGLWATQSAGPAGTVTINSAATIGANTVNGRFDQGIVVAGIGIVPIAGQVSITQSGNSFVGGTGPIGIHSLSTNTTDITLSAGSTINVAGTAGTSYGIFTAGGLAGTTHTVTVNGTIDPPDIGVSDLQAGTGANAVVSVGAAGSITANNIGAEASSSGAGNVTVTTLAGGTVTQNVLDAGFGVTTANAGGGFISIANGGTISSFGTGINASHTGTGNIIITGAGAVTGDANGNFTGNGITAAASGGANNVSVTYTGNVSGTSGIVGTATGTGNVTIDYNTGTATGTSNGGTAAAIFAQTAAGTASVNNNGTLTSPNDGVRVSTTAGGAINVTGGGAITADTNNGSAGDGIRAIASSAAAGTAAGPVTINYTGNITSGTAGGIGGEVGVFAQSINSAVGGGTNNVSVTTSGNIIVGSSGAQGIFAGTQAVLAPGAVNVNVTTGTVRGQTIGVEAFTNNTLIPGAAGNVLVATGAGSTVGGATSDGIFAHTNSTGAGGIGSVTVNVIGTGNPAGAARVGLDIGGGALGVVGGIGINAQINDATAANPLAVLVQATNAQVDATGHGINAFTSGLGSVTVNVDPSNVFSLTGNGINVDQSTANGGNAANNSTLTVALTGGTAGNPNTIGAPAGNGINMLSNSDAFAGAGTNTLSVSLGDNTVIGGSTASFAGARNSDPINGNNVPVGVDGIHVDAQGAAWAGTINVTGGANDQIVANANGITAQTTGTFQTGGNINVTMGNVAGAPGNGGTIVAGASGGPGNGIQATSTTGAFSSSTNITVQNAMNIVANTGTGILTAAVNGNQSVTNNANISFLNAGISSTSTGTGNIVMTNTAGTKLTAFTNGVGVGMLGLSTGGAGSVTLINNGTIDPPLDGMRAEITNVGNASPVAATNNGAITATRYGVFAGTQGLGSVTIGTGAGSTTTGGQIGLAGYIINGSNTSDVNISSAGNVTQNTFSAVLTPADPPYSTALAADSGVNSNIGIVGFTNGNGSNVSISSTGNVTANGFGIFGIVNGTLNPATTGNVSITAGNVTSGVGVAGPSIGVFGTNRGQGSVTINQLAGTTIDSTNAGGNATAREGIGAYITSPTGAGASTSTAAVVVNSQGTVRGGTSSNTFGESAAIIGHSSGTGDVTITANNVTGGAGGVLGITTGAGNVTINTLGGGTVTANGGGAGIGNGIGLDAVTGTGNITMNVAGNVTGSGQGIAATTAGGGSINIATTGGTASTIAGNTTQGIVASAANGNIVVTANSNVTGTTRGIDAQTTGTGSVTVGGDTGTVTGQGANAAIFVRTGATGAGNVLTVTGSGNTTSNGAGGIGIDAALTGAQAGNIVITRTGNISATSATGIALQATTAGTGNITVDTGPGSINAGTGMVISATSGAVNVNAVGPITTTAAGGDSFTTADDVTTLTNNTTGDGINVRTTSGNINVTTGAGAITATGDGIDVRSATGTVNVSVGAGGAAGTPGVIAIGGPVTVLTVGPVTDAVFNAITAASLTGQNVTVNTLGTVNGGIDGVFAATVGGAGNVVVNTSSDVTGATHGIHATVVGGGTGNITVHSTGTVAGGAGAGGVGILATTATSGNVTVTAENAVSGGAGISATSGTGSVTVNATGSVAATAGTGVNATTGGAGNVVVQTGSTVTGTVAGINAATTGAGTVTVNTTGAVTGGTGNGIVTNATTGATSIATLGAVSSTVDAINATSTSGNITIAATGAVTGNTDANGSGGAIVALSTAAGNIGITTGSGLVSGGFAVTGAGFGVIDAQTSGAGTIGVSVGTGGINATGTGGANGIDTRAVTGQTTIVSNGVITSLVGTPPNNGISAVATGAGGISITTTAAITAAQNGITASSAGGTIAVSTGGNVTGGATGTLAGINVANTTGNVQVQTSDTSNVTGGVGINVAATTGNVVIETHGTVTGTGAAAGGVSGDGIHIVTTTGNVQLGTFGAVTGNVANAGSDGIDITTTTGNVTVTTANLVQGDPGIIISSGGVINLTTIGPVIGALNGIQTTETGANSTTINVLQGSSVTGGTNGIVATGGAGNVTVATAGNVTGNAGNGIQTSSAGTTQITVLNSGTTVTGTGTGNSGISATGTAAASVVGISVAGGTTVTNTTGRGITLTSAATAGGGGSNTLSLSGAVIGAGSVADPVVALSTTGSATTTININGPLGVVRSANASGAARAGDLAIDNTGSTAGSVVINNTSGEINGATGIATRGLIGRVTLTGPGATTINNSSGGLWTVFGANTFSNGGDAVLNDTGSTVNVNFNPITNATLNAAATTFTFGTAATDTLTNNGLFNSAGTVSFFSLENVNNNGLNGNSVGTFNVGSVAGVLGEQTNFSSGGTATTAGAVQTVNNSGTFNVLALQSQVGAYRGSLNFFGAGGSNFNNSVGGTGGLINMQTDGGSTKNAVTLNTVSMAGTSDLSYTYNWAGAVPANAYNFNGGANSRIWVDTFLGAPGSTSDRLVVGGNVTGNTLIKVNDTNLGGPGAFNPNGITVVAVQGGGGNNFRVDPTSVNYVNFGPLGAIQKGFFVDPLIYVPGGALTSTPGLGNGNAYKFFSLPGLFGFNLPVAQTAAQNIWSETAFAWEDRQSELRSLHARGISIANGASGGGADLPVKAVKPAPVSEVDYGMWLKAIGSWTRRTATADYGQISPLFSVLNSPNNYKQSTYGIVGGFDVGKSNIFTSYDSFVFEVMGGYVNSGVTFDQPNVFAGGAGPTTFTKFDYSGGTVGVSGTYMIGGFFSSTLLKADFLNLKISGIPGAVCANTAIASCSQTVNSNTWGVLSDMGYRFQWGRYFLEPIGTVAYIRSDIDNLNLAGVGILANFNNGEATRLAGGFRAGGVVTGDQVRYLETSVTARVWDQVAGHNNVTFTNPGTPFTLTDKFAKVWGETDLQFDWINRGNGWSGFVKLGAKYNEEFLTGTTKAGMRYQW